MTCPIPPDPGAANVTIRHEKAARYHLPYRGEARIAVRLWDDDPCIESRVPFEVSELRFTIDEQKLEGTDELELTIEFVSGTTEYWLRGVRVEFE